MQGQESDSALIDALVRRYREKVKEICESQTGVCRASVILMQFAFIYQSAMTIEFHHWNFSHLFLIEIVLFCSDERINESCSL